MSGVTLTREYEHAHEALGFSWLELVTVARTGLEHAFLPTEVRRAVPPSNGGYSSSANIRSARSTNSREPM